MLEQLDPLMVLLASPRVCPYGVSNVHIRIDKRAIKSYTSLLIIFVNLGLGPFLEPKMLSQLMSIRDSVYLSIAFWI